MLAVRFYNTEAGARVHDPSITRCEVCGARPFNAWAIAVPGRVVVTCGSHYCCDRVHRGAV